MSRYWKHFLVLALICLCIQGVASITVGNIAISPSTDLVSGQTQVRASFVINFPSSGGYTFDSDNALQLFSEMDNPTWSYSIVQNGIENPSMTAVGQNVNINGFVLSYSSKNEISMKVTMEAVAPVVTTSEEKVVIAVRELNSAGAVIKSSEVVKTKLVINPGQIQTTVSEARNSLSALRGQIDQLAASGIDVSSLEQIYSTASSALDTAGSTSDYSRAAQSLNSANTAISDANSLINQLTIQKTINDVDGKMEEVNALITDFKVNRSMTSDARVTTLILVYDDAADLVSEAKDLLSAQDFQGAMNKANEAQAKADEALTQARDLKQQLETNPLSSVGSAVAGVFTGGVVIIIVVAVIVVLAIVGFVLFRRRRKWDELG